MGENGHAKEVVLFGVSLGSIASSIAAPEVEGLRAVVLDAPIQDLDEAAYGSLRRSRRRLPALPWFVLEQSLGALQRWCGASFREVRPGDGVRALDPEVAVMLITGGEDERATPEQVRGLYASLSTLPDRRWLWFVEESDHGDVWEDDPTGYRAHLSLVVERTR